MPSDSERTLTAVRWSYVGVFARAASQLIANIILARLLGPAEFGLFALTLLMVAPARLISELGLGSALIQKESLSKEDVHVAFTWLMGAGMVTAFVFFLVADYAAHFFYSPQVAEFIRYTSIIFLLYPVTTIASSQLQRNLDLKAMQIVNVVAYAIGFLGVGVVSGLMGLGGLSLILAFVSQAMVECILFFVLARPHLRLHFKKVDGRTARFARRVIPANLTNWILDCADNFIIGKLFGAHSLGMYAVVFNFVRTPTGHLATTLQNVLFSTSSRIQLDDARLGRTYIVALSAVSLIAFPIFFGVAAVAETCVVAIYGIEWKNASPLLIPLAIAMPLHCITAVTGPVLWGKGRVGQDLRISLAMGLVLVLVLLTLSAISLTAVVWGVFAVYLIRAMWMTATISHLCAIRRSRILKAVIPAMVLGLVVGVTLFVVNRQLIEYYPAAWIRLTYAILLGALLTLIWLIIVGQRGLPDELNHLIKRLVEHRPLLAKCWARCGN